MWWKLRDSSENKDGESIELLTGGCSSEGNTFFDIEGSLLKNWDWESIELNTGGCSSVDSTILNF